jgi:alkylhydroperoxidase/carboxymuconolactone decarboxylase family protein YurZ
MPALEALVAHDQIAALRSGFVNAEVVAAGNASLAGPIPQARAWVESTSSYFFATPDNMGPTHRELCCLTVLTALKSPSELAVHVYWGLMVGLTVNQIADAIFLGGNYGGVSAYSQAVKAATVTLQTLATLATSATSGGASPDAVKQALSASKVLPAVGAAIRAAL